MARSDSAKHTVFIIVVGAIGYRLSWDNVDPALIPLRGWQQKMGIENSKQAFVCSLQELLQVRRAAEVDITIEPSKWEGYTPGDLIFSGSKVWISLLQGWGKLQFLPKYILKIIWTGHKNCLCLVLPGSYGGWRPRLAWEISDFPEQFLSFKKNICSLFVFILHKHGSVVYY